MGDQQTKTLVGERIMRTFHVAKTLENLIDVDKALFEAHPEDLWGYASVEVTDSAGDVVRVKGIDTSTYHRPPQSFLKVLAQHQGSSDTTGEPFILGRVEEFKLTKALVPGQENPAEALAFRMSWARDGDGILTPLAKTYKGLVDGGYIDSFSVGMLVKDYEQIDTGLDFTETTLYEISMVTIPANGYANVMRSMETPLTEEMIEGMLTKMFDGAKDSICTLGKEVEGRIATLTSEVSKRLDVLSDRLDELESGLVAKSVPAPVTGDRKQGEQLAAVRDLAKQLKRFAGN